MSRVRSNPLIIVLTALALMAPAAQATIGSAVLEVAGAPSTPTHWDIPLDATTNVVFCGVTEAEVGGPLPSSLTAWVKSSDFGNTELIATRIGDTACYEFDYTPPSDACNTTIVAYIETGLLTNNDLADDGILNGSGTAASGLRFLDENGLPIDCAVPTEASSWSLVKGLYR